MEYTDSMVYNTSIVIADLKPLIGKTKHHVKNTVDFSKDLRNMCILEDEIMNSHDVVSLFMKIPLNQAMSVIRKKLESDNTLHKRT